MNKIEFRWAFSHKSIFDLMSLRQFKSLFLLKFSKSLRKTKEFCEKHREELRILRLICDIRVIKYVANSNNLVDFPWIFFFPLRRSFKLRVSNQMPHLPWSQSHLLQSHFGKVALVSLCPDWKTWYLLAVLESYFPSYLFFQHLNLFLFPTFWQTI